MTDIISAVMGLRRNLYTLLLALKETDSKDISQAYGSLRMARAHLGGVLLHSGQRDPYAPARERRHLGLSREIPQEADTAEKPFPLTGDGITDLDALRIEVRSVTSELESLYIRMAELPAEGKVYDHLLWANQHLIEANYYLGFALGTIRDQHESKTGIPAEAA